MLFLKKYNVQISILCSVFLSILLVIWRVNSTKNTQYVYLIWNLFLAYVPLFFMYVFLSLRSKNTKSLRFVLIALWLIFLPNSFYTLTDFVHLSPTIHISILFDIVLLSSFVWNGFIFGLSSVFLFHEYLLKKIQNKMFVTGIIGGVFFLCSFAIYLGRYLRWNSWDVITNPADVLFDISSRITDPAAHKGTVSVTVLFFVFISITYGVVWSIGQKLRHSNLESALLH
jgi:uncharacterized membrane protein